MIQSLVARFVKGKVYYFKSLALWKATRSLCILKKIINSRRSIKLKEEEDEEGHLFYTF